MKSITTKVEDNFLDKKDFNELYKAITDRQFPWYYNNIVATKTDKGLGIYYFNHMFYDNQPCSPYYGCMQPVFDKLNVKALMTVKANLYPRTDKIIKHKLHKDYRFSCKSGLLMMNTCDGHTYLKEDDKAILSVANRMIHFNSFRMHNSTTTTNANTRLTININYF